MEAVRAGRTITRIALAFEAGRDGFWLARWLEARGVEAHVDPSLSLRGPLPISVPKTEIFLVARRFRRTAARAYPCCALCRQWSHIARSTGWRLLDQALGSR